MATSTNPRRAVGVLGERIAREHLTRAGYSIVDANFRTRFGELDLIAADDRSLVFPRTRRRLGGPGGGATARGDGRARRRRGGGRAGGGGGRGSGGAGS